MIFYAVETSLIFGPVLSQGVETLNNSSNDSHPELRHRCRPLFTWVGIVGSWRTDGRQEHLQRKNALLARGVTLSDALC